MKPKPITTGPHQAHRRGRTWDIGGEPVTLAQAALGVACGFALAIFMFGFVVLFVAAAS